MSTQQAERSTWLEVTEPATEEVMATVPRAGVEETDAAVSEGSGT